MKISGSIHLAPSKVRSRVSVILLALMILSGSKCGKDPTPPEPIVYPDSNLSFIQHIHPLFLRNCASSGCHESTSPANGLDLESPAPTFNSINGPAIFPFDAEQSRLYRVLLSDYGGISRMPKNRAALMDGEIRAIRTWINEGAAINN